MSLSEEKVCRLIELVEENYSTSAIAVKLGISPAAVSKIYKRITGRSVREFRKTRQVRYGQKI